MIYLCFSILFVFSLLCPFFFFLVSFLLFPSLPFLFFSFYISLFFLCFLLSLLFFMSVLCCQEVISIQHNFFGISQRVQGTTERRRKRREAEEDKIKKKKMFLKQLYVFLFFIVSVWLLFCQTSSPKISPKLKMRFLNVCIVRPFFLFEGLVGWVSCNRNKNRKM